MIDGAIVVTHAHKSGVEHKHVVLFGRRCLRRSDLTPYLGRHRLGIRGGFHLSRVTGRKHAHSLAKYLTKGIVDLKDRLERFYGPIARLNSVIIPLSLRRRLGVFRRRVRREPGRWLVFRVRLLEIDDAINDGSVDPSGFGRRGCQTLNVS